MKNKIRPFTFTYLSKENYLEFMIKIYKEHQGATNMLGRINAGKELITHDVWGVIEYKGPGFLLLEVLELIPLFQYLVIYVQKKLASKCLLYFNTTSEGVIIKEELKEMLQEGFINLYTREKVMGFIGKRINRKYLIEHIIDFVQHFYICGSTEFVKNKFTSLEDFRANIDVVVFGKS